MSDDLKRTPRTGAIPPEDEGDLDRMARSADVDAGIEGDESEVPHEGIGPGAGAGSPSRMHADRSADAGHDQSYPSLRGDTVAQPDDERGEPDAS